MVAIAVNEDGYREVLGVVESMRACKRTGQGSSAAVVWVGIKLAVGDKFLGMLEVVGEVFSEAQY